ncbi:MAG: hypothetical protein KBS95_07130, partial [Alistipes sp.]|nr:hypothetical protein [Candidatus Alistipes equi]
QEKGSEKKFTRRIYLHIYYNHMRAAKDRSDFEQDLMDIKQKLESGAFTLDQLSESAQNKAEQYLIIKTKGSKLQVAFNEKACQERGRYHGYFTLVASHEKNAEEALRKYRKRENIEGMFRAGKQSADMDYVRVWDAETLRGRLFVQFITLCYYEYFSEKLRQVKSTLGITNGDKAHDTKENLEMERKLFSWISNTPIYAQLQWFDIVENVNISAALGKKRWTTEITARDNMYLEKLGIELTK